MSAGVPGAFVAVKAIPGGWIRTVLACAAEPPLADGDLQLTFANVPYAAWSTWLARVERELGARAHVVTARATATPGAADIEVVLRLARR